MILRYTVLFGALLSIFVHANDNGVMHKLDDKGMQELHELIKCNAQYDNLYVVTESKAQYEYWALADRIQRHTFHEKVFNSKEQQCIDELICIIFQDKMYKDAFAQAKCNKIEWTQYRRIGALLAKKELERRGVKYQEKPSLASFDEFLKVNTEISDEAVPWMIAGSMFLFYLRQIERNHQIKTEIL